MTIAEFDVWVKTADDVYTYELHEGVVYAHAAASVDHERLCTRLGTQLIARLAAPFEVFLNSRSVRESPERASSVVPDFVVTREPTPPGQTYVTAPTFVCEIIEASSVVNDLIRKPRIYSAVASIEEYLVVDSRSMWVCVFGRSASGELSVQSEGVDSPNAAIRLTSLDIAFTLAELYRGILEPG